MGDGPDGKWKDPQVAWMTWEGMDTGGELL